MRGVRGVECVVCVMCVRDVAWVHCVRARAEFHSVTRVACMVRVRAWFHGVDAPQCCVASAGGPRDGSAATCGAEVLNRYSSSTRECKSAFSLSPFALKIWLGSNGAAVSGATRLSSPERLLAL